MTNNAYKNFTILPKFPIDYFLNIYDKYKDILLNSTYEDFNDVMLHDDASIKLVIFLKNHEITNVVQDMFDVEVPCCGFMINFPRAGVWHPHTDRRPCGLNIPIDVDTTSSHFFSGDVSDAIENKNALDLSPQQDASRRNKKFLYEPEKYQFYNSRHPILLNTKQVHGFANYADTYRTLFSIDFIEPYGDVLETFPKDWYDNDL